MREIWLAMICWGIGLGAAIGAEPAKGLPCIVVSADGKGFVEEGTGKEFRPWGFNYDHDEKGRLIEDYWHEEWEKVAGDIREMKALGGNVVRLHLQVGKFLSGPSEANEKELVQLEKFVALAEEVGLYLDVTGLGCYHKKDVPAWYDEMSEEDRWKTQAFFWKTIAGRVGKSPAIFCYDLMNEPISPAGKRGEKDWLGPAFGDKHFVQMISLDDRGRPRVEIARAWIKQLTQSIREVDKKHLVTVGMVDWSLDRPGLTSGFVPSKLVEELDFLCVHLYPEKGKLKEGFETVAGFALGKPVVIEETFPLKCSVEEAMEFLQSDKNRAVGAISFYWGKDLTEMQKSSELVDKVILAWLEKFTQGKRLSGN
ncbi:MAG: cellulase family glycosylhydrolase [Pirellulales bacterium]